MKTKNARNEMAYKTVVLAKSVENKEKRDACIATTIAYASRMLANVDLKKLFEVINIMADLGAAMKEFFGAEARAEAKAEAKAEARVEMQKALEESQKKWERMMAEKDLELAELRMQLEALAK